jgi:hypothetical protein
MRKLPEQAADHLGISQVAGPAGKLTSVRQKIIIAVSSFAHKLPLTFMPNEPDCTPAQACKSGLIGVTNSPISIDRDSKRIEIGESYSWTVLLVPVLFTFCTNWRRYNREQGRES